MSSSKPLLAIVGQTASGKTALALELARKFGGEIVAADSRTIYKRMNIGTAKPTDLERRQIPHHLINIIEPDQSYSAAEFKLAANQAIDAVHRHDHLPILVGGTGLYIDSVLHDYDFIEADTEQRQELSNLDLKTLQSKVDELGVQLNESDYQNPRRLIAAIERGGAAASKRQLRANTLLIGIRVDPDELRRRIEQRVHQMVEAGFEEEVKGLVERYGKDAPGLNSTGYKSFIKLLDGDISRDQAIDETIGDTLNLAKRQMTWFKRNQDIKWVDDPSEAFALVSGFLNRL